jgi:hypothetical protein
MDQGKVASTDQRLCKHIMDGVDLGVQAIVGARNRSKGSRPEVMVLAFTLLRIAWSNGRHFTAIATQS